MESSNGQWDDLPDDLLGLIILRITIWDHVSFGGVCRSWRQKLRSMSKPLSLHRGSWLIAYENDGGHRCYFHDLLNSSHYAHEFPELHGTLCLASRYGWSLMWSGLSTFFFFNFFSRQRIVLPEWKSKEASFEIFSFFSMKSKDYKKRDLVASFSDFSSSDCVVVVVHRIDDYTIEISRCSLGEKAWSTRVHSMKHRNRNMGKISGALVQKDVIYCFSEDTNANLETWCFDAAKLSLATVMTNGKSQMQNQPVPRPVHGKKIDVFTLNVGLFEKFLRNIPSLASWSATRSDGCGYSNSWQNVSLCPFVLTQRPKELASGFGSDSNLNLCVMTYRCGSAPNFSSHYPLHLQEGPKKGSPHLQVFYVEPHLFQA